MKKIIIALGLFSQVAFGQDSLATHFSDLIEENEYQTVLKECLAILDTTKIDAKRQLANNYVANVLYYQTKFEGSIDYSKRALRCKGPYAELAYNNLGTVYARLKQFDTALVYFHKRLALIQNNVDARINTLGNIAIVHIMQNKFDMAKPYLDTALNIAPISKLDMIYVQYGDLYFYQNNFKSALPYYYKALGASNLNTKEAVYQSLAESFARLNMPDSTVKYYDLYNEVKALINENEASKDITELFVKYETQDKERQIEIQTAQVARQKKAIVIGVISGIILVIVLIIIHQLYLNVKRKKNIVVEQAANLRHKNREIEDSIIYAKGIQEAILPIINDEKVFVLYKPKDIISGDFYWTAEKNNKKYYAVADCTGHGVPGALMSMLCSQLLDEAVEQQDSPADILAFVQDQLNAKMKAMGRNDGMEVGLVAIDSEFKTVAFAGIGRSLYVVIDGVTNSFKGEAYLELKAGDMIYMSTDGYTDQFGTNTKKFGSKRLKEEFAMCAIQTPENQLKMFNSTLNYWQQDVEQTDDILLMGIKF